MCLFYQPRRNYDVGSIPHGVLSKYIIHYLDMLVCYVLFCLVCDVYVRLRDCLSCHNNGGNIALFPLVLLKMLVRLFSCSCIPA